jgi:hypothetical protein
MSELDSIKMGCDKLLLREFVTAKLSQSILILRFSLRKVRQKKLKQ